MCLKTGQASFGCVLSAVSKVASGTFRSWLSVTAGVGVLMVSGLSGTVGFCTARCRPEEPPVLNILTSVTGYLSRGIALNRGESTDIARRA